MEKYKFNIKEWVNLGRWVQPPLSGCFWCYWHETESTKEATGLTFIPMAFFDGYTLLKKTDHRTIQQLVENICMKKRIKKFISHFEKVGHRYEKKHLAVLKKNHKDVGNYCSALFSTYQELLGLWSLAIFLGDAVQEYIVKNHIATEEELLESQALRKKTWLEQQNTEINSFAKQWTRLSEGKNINGVLLKKYPALFLKIKHHVEKYEWYGTHHWVGEGYNLKKCCDDINGAAKRGVITPTHSQKKLPDIVALLNMCSYWRTHCAEVAVKVVFSSRPILSSVAKKFSLSYEELTLLSAKEIIDILKKKQNIVPLTLQQRKKSYGCYIQHGREHIVVDNPLKKILQTIATPISKDIKELRGLVACRGGIIKGTVGKVITPEDIKRFQRGSILVASETTPDFIPAMKIAIAIITERGGITSHAAIVSRELGIPCIIGTEIATKVLKDGDLVEVDAEKGIVRKL